MAKVCPECGREFSPMSQSVNCPICKVRLVDDGGIDNSDRARQERLRQLQSQRTAQQRQMRTQIQDDEEELVVVQGSESANTRATNSPSALSIIALVFSILGCLSFVGTILAIIDLCIKDGKKKVCSIISLAITCLWCVIVLIAALGSDSNKLKTVKNTATNNVVEQQTQGQDAGADLNTKDTDENLQVDVIAEYTLPDGVGWYTRHFIILRNNSNKTVDVSTSSLAYDNDGNIIGADNSELNALGAGCTSILYDAFETDVEVSYYDTNFDIKESRYYESVIQDLTYVQNNVAGGAVFQVTNNGTESAEFVKGYALFFKNGNLVHYEIMYFTDDDSEIKPGATISKQMTSYEDFDSIQFYLTGRK